MGRARRDGSRALNLPDLFALYSELAVAIAGFSGVASAFAGRERRFRPTELTRLHAVLANSSAVLAGCLAFYCASSSGLGEPAPSRVAAAFSLVFTLPMPLVLVPRGWRFSRDPDSTTELWVMCAVTACTAAILGLYAAALFRPSASALLVIGFSLQLLFALWMFVRLLTRPN